MAHWTYFLLVIVWAFSLQVESKCQTTYQIKNQDVKLFENDITLRPCVKVGECVIGWKHVSINGQEIVEYEALAPTYGYIAVGLNNHDGNWRGADIAIVTGTTTSYLSKDAINAPQDTFKPVLDSDGQEITANRIQQNGELRTVAFSRPRYLSSGNDRTVNLGTFLMCAYGPQKNLDNLATLTLANANQETASSLWNGGSTLSASVSVLLLVTAMAAYLNMK